MSSPPYLREESMMRMTRIARRRITSVATLGSVLFVSALAATAQAQDACIPRDDLLDAHTYLRSLSLDLRGDVPTADELSDLDSATDPLVRAQEIERSWLSSEDFLARVVRRHHDLLWNNLANQSLVAVNSTLSTTRLNVSELTAGSAETQTVWLHGSQMAVIYRGSTGAKLTAQIPCLPILQSELNKATTLTAVQALFPTAVGTGVRNGIRYVDIKNPLNQGATDINKDTIWHREGYVDGVHPYWAPDTSIAVCAFDAQTLETGLDGVTKCDDASVSTTDPTCGCGQELRYCGTSDVTKTLLTAFADAIDHNITDVVKNGGSYFDIFLSNTAYINGPIAYFYKYQTKVFNRLGLAPVPLPSIPDDMVDFTATTNWRAVDAGEQASGVLTMPGFLLRFQTNRARANRFFDKFLCQPFQAPAQSLPSPDDPCSAEPDLQKRCGCSYCHVTLEPAAAHWGRWRETGSGYLNPTDFPKKRDECATCANNTSTCSTTCRTWYHVTSSMADDPYLGMLNAYTFLKDSDTEGIEQGPRLLVLSSMVDGSLQACTVHRAFEWLVGRSPADDNDDAWIDELTESFTASGYNYLELVRTIVESESYRSVP